MTKVTCDKCHATLPSYRDAVLFEIDEVANQRGRHRELCGRCYAAFNAWLAERPARPSRAVPPVNEGPPAAAAATPRAVGCIVPHDVLLDIIGLGGAKPEGGV